ncbi:Ger(x)C family spore germination protein [Paenibacillus thermoaerophilus]|uniref:Ger(x)C family spore germination protein n=1 Tax=Paenibacillus thermoaerophilus TaxID=1215385 RepID=UPI0024830D11|nr:Ger(x)C family spore germination protein [Paenibacillus thermoaerophilus]
MACLLFSVLALAACAQKEIIDKITMPIVQGYDKAEPHQIELTVAAPVFHADRSVSDKIYSSVSHTVKNAREQMRSEIRKPFSIGKLSVTLYSKDLAKDGLEWLLDPLMRDARISNKSYLAIVDGKVKELLESKFSLEEEKGVFLKELIDGKIQVGHLPRTNLHKFEYLLYGKGMDPYLPILKLQDDTVGISGLALFKHDKYVTSINLDQMRVFRLLRENVNHGTYEVKLDQNQYAIVENQSSKVRYRVGGTADKPEVTINLALKGAVTEYSGVRLTERDLRNIETGLEKQIADTGKMLLHTFQKRGIDPFGIGDRVRSKTRNWEEEAWEGQYPDTPIALNVEVKVVESGVSRH